MVEEYLSRGSMQTTSRGVVLSQLKGLCSRQGAKQAQREPRWGRGGAGESGKVMMSLQVVVEEWTSSWELDTSELHLRSVPATFTRAVWLL